MKLKASWVYTQAGTIVVQVRDMDNPVPTTFAYGGGTTSGSVTPRIPLKHPKLVYEMPLPKGANKTERRLAMQAAVNMYELRMGVVSTHKDKPDVKPKRPRLPNVDTRQSGQDSVRATPAKQVAACGVGADPP